VTLNQQEHERLATLSAEHRGYIERIRVLEAELKAAKTVVAPIIETLISKQRELDELLEEPSSKLALAAAIDARCKELERVHEQALNSALESADSLRLQVADFKLQVKSMSEEINRLDLAALDAKQEASDLRKEVHRLNGELHALQLTGGAYAGVNASESYFDITRKNAARVIQQESGLLVEPTGPVAKRTTWLETREGSPEIVRVYGGLTVGEARAHKVYGAVISNHVAEGWDLNSSTVDYTEQEPFTATYPDERVYLERAIMEKKRAEKL
jgi:hypothetical protein